MFPKINWNPKGAQIKQIIEECRLRPVNVLFIDDNPHNLGEAIQILPDINTAAPDVIPTLLDSKYLKGNDDKEHKRLKQFKVLEKKQVAQNACSSNEEFLRQSNIKVDICYDCENHKDRILDLINRSNQLNYTKIRLTNEGLDTLLADKSYKNCYIKVKDNYGDYGIIGFASLVGNKAEHFLFSCRTIGMGVEQYVYSKLGYPDFIKIGDVISDVKKNYCPDWINTSEKTKIQKTNNINTSVLLRGGCDLKQMEPYIHFKNFKTEFNYMHYHRDHTVFAIDSFYDYPELEEIQEKVPFLWSDNFKTEMFSEKYDFIITSVLMDYFQSVYQYNKNPNIKIAFGNFQIPNIKDYIDLYSDDDLKWFNDNFKFIGRISAHDFRKNLEFIRNHIGKNTKLIILNGCEVPHENPNEPNQYKSHIELNKVVDDFVANSENTYLVDIRKIVTKRKQLADNIRHYERNVYFKIAKEISTIILEVTGEKIRVDKQRKYKACIKRFVQSLFSVRNKYHNAMKHKVITILGIKIKIKCKNKPETIAHVERERERVIRLTAYKKANLAKVA